MLIFLIEIWNDKMNDNNFEIAYVTDKLYEISYAYVNYNKIEMWILITKI